MSMTYKQIIQEERDRARRELLRGYLELWVLRLFMGALAIFLPFLGQVIRYPLGHASSFGVLTLLIALHIVLIVSYSLVFRGWRSMDRSRIQSIKGLKTIQAENDSEVLSRVLRDLLCAVYARLDDENDELNVLARRAEEIISEQSSHPALQERPDSRASPANATYRVEVRVALDPNPSILERLQRALGLYGGLCGEMRSDRDRLFLRITVVHELGEVSSTKPYSHSTAPDDRFIEMMEASTVVDEANIASVVNAASNFEVRREQIITEMAEAISMAEAAMAAQRGRREEPVEEAEEVVLATSGETKGSTR